MPGSVPMVLMAFKCNEKYREFRAFLGSDSNSGSKKRLS
jgi:hypothetical protein